MRHLDLLNAFLALRFKHPGFPTCLADLGYIVHSIGVTVALPDGSRAAPDVITSQPDRGFALLVEVKGGKQIDEEQLQRMLAMTPEILRDHAYLPVPEPLSQYRVQAAFVCNEEDRNQIAEQIGDKPVAVISFDGSRFRLSGESIGDPELGACLARGQVAAGSPPIAIIPFDRESSDDEIARVVLPHVVNAWLSGAGTIRPDDIVARTHHLVHADMGSTGSGSERSDIVRKVKRLIDTLAKGELGDLLEQIPGQPAWRFRRGLPNDSTRTRELQKVQRAAEKYLEKLGTGRPTQLKLFEPDEPEDEG